MPKPICVKCQRFYRPKKNGVLALEGKPIHPDAQPGIEQADLWTPYKLWHADLMECRGCGHQLIVGFGHSPIWQDFQPDQPKETHRVNDC